MIARIWNGCVPQDKTNEYLDYVRRTGAADCIKASGNSGVLVLSNSINSNTKISFISLWETRKLMLNFFGSLVPRLYPDDKNFLVSSDEEIVIAEAFFYGPQKINTNGKLLQYPAGIII